MTPDMTPCSRIKTQSVRMIRRTWSYPNCRLEVRDSSLRGRCDLRGRRRCWQSTRWCTAAAAPPAPAGSGPDPWTALRSDKSRLRMGRRPLLDVQRALRAGQGRVNELGNGCEGTTLGTRLSSRPGHVRPNALREDALTYNVLTWPQMYFLQLIGAARHFADDRCALFFPHGHLAVCWAFNVATLRPSLVSTSSANRPRRLPERQVRLCTGSLWAEHPMSVRSVGGGGLTVARLGGPSHRDNLRARDCTTQRIGLPAYCALRLLLLSHQLV
jgi:hypothetical protein